MLLHAINEVKEKKKQRKTGETIDSSFLNGIKPRMYRDTELLFFLVISFHLFGYVRYIMLSRGSYAPSGAASRHLYDTATPAANNTHTHEENPGEALFIIVSLSFIQPDAFKSCNGVGTRVAVHQIETRDARSYKREL